MYLKDILFKALLKVYPHVAGKQQEDGRFLSDDNTYNIYQQYVGFYFAYLYTSDRPDNPYYHNEDTLQRAIKAWDHYNSMTNDNGRTKIITYDQYWMDGPEEWGFFYWINTIPLLKDYLSPAKLDEWNNKIHKIAELLRFHIENPEAIEDDYRETFIRDYEFSIPNHFVWAVLAYYRYGMIYFDEHAMKVSEDIMDEIIKYQLPNGSWLEAGSSVVQYCNVSLNAISIYERYSNNPNAKTAVRKGLDFVLNTTYPDLSRIETLDGRNRYNKNKGVLLTPAFAQFKDGLVYLSESAKYAYESNLLTKVDTHAVVSIAHNTFLLADDLEIVDDSIDDYIPSSTFYPEIKAKIIRKGPWVIPFACMEQKVFNNRFQLYKQNLISVFNKSAGLVIGGGHSVTQPQFSSFNVISGDKFSYIHDKGEIFVGVDGMSLSYGGKDCRLEIKSVSHDEVVISYSVDGLSEVDRAYVNIPLVGAIGDNIILNDREIVHGYKYTRALIPEKTDFSYRSLKFNISEDVVYNYPVFPYNSYLLKQPHNIVDAAAILTVELNYLKPEVVLTING